MRSILLIIPALSILVLSGSAAACFSPTDSFASEVLLNRAGISYDLSGIKPPGTFFVIEMDNYLKV
ncbi:MAG TPA: hypothetical protein VIO58_13700 [Candidatus Methanoperedens sp.]